MAAKIDFLRVLLSPLGHVTTTGSGSRYKLTNLDGESVDVFVDDLRGGMVSIKLKCWYTRGAALLAATEILEHCRLDAFHWVKVYERKPDSIRYSARKKWCVVIRADKVWAWNAPSTLVMLHREAQKRVNWFKKMLACQ